MHMNISYLYNKGAQSMSLGHFGPLDWYINPRAENDTKHLVGWAFGNYVKTQGQ